MGESMWGSWDADGDGFIADDLTGLNPFDATKEAKDELLEALPDVAKAGAAAGVAGAIGTTTIALGFLAAGAGVLYLLSEGSASNNLAKAAGKSPLKGLI